jgi:hypothetical protein
MRVLRGPGANLPARLADSMDRSEIFHSWDLSEEALSYKRDNTTRFNAYPALSVPLGPEDEIVCPPEHQEFVRSLLADVGAIDVLVVGYSAFDQTVLNLLADAAKEIRSLYVVNADLESAVEVTRRMWAHFGMNADAENVGAADEPFQRWVRSRVAEYPEWVSKRG